MKHVSCGGGCTTHGPVSGKANRIAGRFEMTCPAGQLVHDPSYLVSGREAVLLTAGGTGRNVIAEEFDFAPATAAELAHACEKALGGKWSEGKHKNGAKSVQTKVVKTVQLRARCTAGGPWRGAGYFVELGVICVDTDF